MTGYNLLVSLLNYSHIIFSSMILIVMCVKFPKKVKDTDPNWLHNNIGDLIGRSFAIGGFLTLCIALTLLVIEGRWPSEYVQPTTIATSIFMVAIYLLVLAHHEWKTWATDIEKKYGTPKPTEVSKEDKTSKNKK